MVRNSMAEVFNNQRKVRINAELFRAFTDDILPVIKETFGKDLSIALVSDPKMRQLNKQFRGKNSTTDVLSFPYEPDEFMSEPPEVTGGSRYIGDIVISAEQAERQAKENRLTLENEIKQLILHGLLHLCGYDHETDNGEMNARELELRDKLGI